jgi:hypothetical protein
MMASAVMTLVDEIRRRKLSRNKHFTLLSRREYREARRIQRYLDGLAADLSSLADGGELDLGLEDGPDGRFVLTVEVTRLGLRRRCYLCREELDYFTNYHPDVAQLITDATGLPMRCGVTAGP